VTTQAPTTNRAFEATSAEVLSQSLMLPCGATLPNRIMKSAMAEGLADARNNPTPDHDSVYRRWSTGGAGLLVTGNVMVPPYTRGGSHVVLDQDSDLDAFRRWAKAGRDGDSHLWMQLNHFGRQAQGSTAPDGKTVAPSATPFQPPTNKMFKTPRALEPAEIDELIESFANAAALAKETGFTGVQIHAAHGYLVNQFLSPLVNHRDDEWGGSPEKRMRFLQEVYRHVREAVGAGFPVAIKLNSADFQRGGFSEEESLDVIGWLTESGVDLIEVSGGTYESAAMVGAKISGTTTAREAYFLDFAEKVRSRSSVPLALTGGFRTDEGMASAVASGSIDVVGLARGLTIDPDAPNRIFAGLGYTSAVKPVKTGLKLIDDRGALETLYYGLHLARLAHNQEPKPDLSVWALLPTILRSLGGDGFKRSRAKTADEANAPVAAVRSPDWGRPDVVIHRSIVIDAPVEVVHDIVVDFAAYPEWNPWASSLSLKSGTGQPGERISFRIRGMAFVDVPSIMKEQFVSPTEARLVWGDSGLGVVGRHYYNCTAIDGGSTLFEQTETYEGRVAKLIPWKRWLDNHFVRFNEALKERAEARVRQTT
jgi:2,4-dienoyl-CoA reductase-like NADH-dependent reductase (Old Yellow Enzyme family)